MTTKIVTTRNIVKNGVEPDWDKLVDFVPLKNEPIFYSPDANNTSMRMKMGDGVTKLKDLPFVPTASIPGFDPNNIVAKRVEHKLTFGTHEYDGSADVNVPIYTGQYSQTTN